MSRVRHIHVRNKELLIITTEDSRVLTVEVEVKKVWVLNGTTFEYLEDALAAIENGEI